MFVNSVSKHVATYGPNSKSVYKVLAIFPPYISSNFDKSDNGF